MDHTETPEDQRILHGRDTVEAYVSNAGFICLQQADALGNEPSTIMLLPHDIPTVVGWLQELAEKVKLSAD